MMATTIMISDQGEAIMVSRFLEHAIPDVNIENITDYCSLVKVRWFFKVVAADAYHAGFAARLGF
jgi:hypothetical protein